MLYLLENLGSMLANMEIKLRTMKTRNLLGANLARGDDIIIVVVFEVNMTDYTLVREGEEFFP